MKTFIAAFSVKKGLPRTREIWQDAKIFNALSLEKAKKKMERFMRRYWQPHGWSWSITYREVSVRKMNSLLKGGIQRVSN